MDEGILYFIAANIYTSVCVRYVVVQKSPLDPLQSQISVPPTMKFLLITSIYVDNNGFQVFCISSATPYAKLTSAARFWFLVLIAHIISFLPTSSVAKKDTIYSI